MSSSELYASSIRNKLARQLTLAKSVFLKFIYPYPRLFAICVTLVISLIAIASYGILNYDAIVALYTKRAGATISPLTVSPALITLIPTNITLAYAMMVIVNVLCVYVLLSIAKQIGFGTLTLWALIFLLTNHLLLNDYRQYIFIAPFYWLLCLLSLWVSLLFGLTQWLKLLIVFCLLYLAAGMHVVAWAWLLLLPLLYFSFNQQLPTLIQNASVRPRFPFGRLIGYYIGFIIVFFTPHILGQQSGYDTLMIFIHNRTVHINKVGTMLSLAWLRDDDSVMSFLFLSTGSFSVVLLRTLFSLGFVSLFLIFYGVIKQQFTLINHKYLYIFIVLILIDSALSTLYLFIQPDYASSAFFIQVLLLLVLASPGLAYVFRKLQQGRYDKHWQLMITWLIVGYVVSGIIPFGPSNKYLREAGEAYSEYDFTSNNAKVLFYGDKNPLSNSPNYINDSQSRSENTWVLWQLGRDDKLPESFHARPPVNVFINRHNDRVLVFAPTSKLMHHINTNRRLITNPSE